jgi:hypothetical protein
MQQPTSSLSRGLPYGGTRQFTFQQSNVSTRTQWRVKYSLSGGYYPVPGSTGSVTATPSINPAVNDEVILFGGGTDTVPTFANCFNNGGAWEGAVRCHCMADDGTGPSGSIPDSPFSWLMFGANQGGNTTGMNFTGFPINFAFMFDAMEVGTAAPQDLDPFITYQENSGGAWCFNNGNNNWSAASNNSSNNPSGWMRKGQTNQAFTRLQALIPWTVETAALPGSMGGNHITFADDLIPVVYTRNASDGGLTGYKGISSLVRWNSTTRQTSDTLSISQPGFSRDRIIAALVSLPWDGSSVPVI